MKITKIEQSRKKGFLRIYLDGQFFTSLSEETVLKYRLSLGKEIDENMIPELSSAKLVRRARERLLYSLDKRLHSEKEMREKLRQDYPPEIIEKAIAELKALGLVDDKAFALAFAENRRDSLKKGPYAIRQELFYKGVCREIIDEVISEVFESENDEQAAAMAAARKYQSELDTPKGKQRAFAALARKGFSYHTIQKVLRELCDFESEYIED